jgi:hypothetical protein
VEPLSFEEAVDQESARLDGELDKMLADPAYQSYNYRHYSYLARGLYADQLQRWIELFPRDQVLIVRNEDMAEDPEKTVNGVFAFLGLTPWSMGDYPRYHLQKKAPMKAETRERLEAYFAEPNQRLYQLIGRDMGW